MRRVMALLAAAALLIATPVSIVSAAAPPRATAAKTITIDGLERKYLVFVPSKATGPMPVVVALHGGGGTARQVERYTRFDELAEREGFIVVYPEAVDGNWNDGRGIGFVQAQKENIDDVKFVRALLDEVAKDNKIDRGRIFATGISNGAIMSHRLAAEASDIIAAIAPVAGGMAPAIADKFKPAHPVSILIIQGDADPLVPIGGGDVAAGLGRKRGKVIPTKDALAKYIELNRTHGDPTESTLDADSNDGTTVEVAKYPDGPGGVKTQYYLVRNGGHNWPGRPLYLPESVIGKASQDFSATDVIWEFFKSCPPRAPAAK